MKTHGDVSAEDRKLVSGLEEMESFLYNDLKTIPLLDVAKGLTCLAHDYYDIDMEEKGEELLIKADSICPMYFVGPVYSEMSKDADFNYLIELIIKTSAIDAMKSLGFGK